MTILAIDTAASLCAACVYDETAQAEQGRAVVDLGKGHAEHVMAVIDEALEKAGLDYGALNAIAVSVGPGSFTGVRVGVAAARGLALALKIPAVGINVLEGLAVETRDVFPGRSVLAVTGQRPEQLFAAAFDADGGLLIESAALPASELAAWAGKNVPVLCGNAAQLVMEAAGTSFDVGSQAATADIATYAGLAAGREAGAEKPKPLYLRPPDAKPQAHFALPRKEG